MEKRLTDTAKFEGVFSLLLTPFLQDGQIDWNLYEQYVEWQLSKKPQGLFAVCGSSEMKWLTLDERLELARRAVKIAGDVPVVATANMQPNRADHADELQRMADTGVAGVVLVPPDGLGTDQSRLGQYFGELADRALCPAMIYEWPLVVPYLIEADVYTDLVKHHNIFGIKDTTCTIEGISAKIQDAPEGIVYQANTPFMLDAIQLGARGIMAITTAACAELVIDFWHQASSGKEGAVKLHQHLVTLDSILIHQSSYPASAKVLANLHGIPMNLKCRNPVTLRAETVKAVNVWYESVYGG